MASEWYYSKDGEKQGPVTSQQLKELSASGQLQPTDLVWREGWTKWARAGSVKGLPAPPPVQPPPLPQARIRPPAPPVPPAPADPPAPTDQTAPPRETSHESTKDLRSTLLEGGKVALLLGVITGLAGDFLEPLAPINGYLFVGVCLLTLTCFVLWIRLAPEVRLQWDHLFPHQSLVFCGVLLTAFGFWFCANLLVGDGRGLLAATFGKVGDLQAAVLNLDESVKDIKSDTTAILDETRKIGDNIDGLGKLGGLIKDPSTPADFYHNARVNELSGDFGGAFSTYQRYVAFDQEFVDPYLSYLQLLRTQRGHQEASHEFSKLRDARPENMAIQFASIHLMSGEERLKELEAFSGDHAEFAPVLLDLADYFSAEEMPNRSGVDAETERTWLEAFVRVSDQGGLTRYYLDKKQAEDLLADARARITKTSGEGAALASDQKVFLANWNEVWVMDNTATAIEYSFDQGEWTPVKNLVKTVVLRRGTIDDKRISDGTQSTVYIRYTDHRGNQSRTYPIPVASASESSAWKDLGQPIDPSRFLNGGSVDGMLQDQQESIRKAMEGLPGSR